MDSERKREIIAAEERYRLLDRLAADLAAKGFYVVGRLTTKPPAGPHPKSSLGPPPGEPEGPRA